MKERRFSLAWWAVRVGSPLWLATFFASAVFAQAESRVGIWELNLAKSTFSPGPAPKRQTLTFQKAGPQWTALLQGIDGSGKPISPDIGNLVINFDGKDHPTPAEDYDTTAWKRIDPAKYEVIRKRAGKVVLISINVVSKDGKTMTITTTGQNANGQAVNNVRVYDKQQEKLPSRNRCNTCPVDAR
jgi:hypothetical protein